MKTKSLDEKQCDLEYEKVKLQILKIIKNCPNPIFKKKFIDALDVELTDIEKEYIEPPTDEDIQAAEKLQDIKKVEEVKLEDIPF
jgi:hypothetical protein